MATDQLKLHWQPKNSTSVHIDSKLLVFGSQSNTFIDTIIQQSRLSIALSVLLLLLVPFRAYTLRRCASKTIPNYMFGLKIATTMIFICIKLVVLVLWALEPVYRTPYALVSATLSLVGAVFLCYLSYMEHTRSICPSSFLALYLLASLFPDIVQARSLYLNEDLHTLMLIYAAGIGVKLLLLVLEAKSKDLYLKPAYRNLSPEVTAGIINRTFFWWINSLFKTGYRKVLSIQDLPVLDNELSSARLQAKLKSEWGNAQKPGSGKSLALAALRCFRGPLLFAALPRVCLIVLEFCQPFLITYAIKYVTQATVETFGVDIGYRLILASIFIYTGLAIATASYKHRLNRICTMLRGALVAIIHARSLELTESGHDDLVAITLMSTDVDIICDKVSAIYEVCAQFIEVGVGIWLLVRQLGWVAAVPLLIIVACSRITPRIGIISRVRQKVWTAAVQQRIAMTSSMLSSMKSLKMMGLSDEIYENIQSQRIKEMEFVKRFRWMIVLLNAIGNIVPVLAPVATFIVFAIQAKLRGSEPLSGTLAFTSLAIISMVTKPSFQLLVIVPAYSSAMASFERIEAFLLGQSRVDLRKETTSSASSVSSQSSVAILSPVLVDLTAAISIGCPTISPSLGAEPILSDIEIRSEVASITMLAGPVGCGKSTILKAILGEVSFTGNLFVSSERIAYCAQTPWLVNDTLKQNVLGLDIDIAIDEAWYKTVLHASGLDEDIMLLPRGDQTVIGSRGTKLSGGQKQRLALARALYSRLDILLLDDVLSALDAKTESLVAEKVLGPQGLTRKLGTTVILVTHSTQYFHLADQIVVLGTDGRIAESGTYDTLRAQTGYISSFLPKSGQPNSDEGQNRPVAMKMVKGVSENDGQDLSRKTGDMSIYSKRKLIHEDLIMKHRILTETGYWLSSVSWPTTFAFISSAGAFSGFLAFSQCWLRWWTEDSNGNLVKYTTVYAALSLLVIIFELLTLCWVMLIIGPRISVSLHSTLLKTVMRAPLSFFAGIDTGVTLNRFSQDMTLIDRVLPVSAMNIVIQSFKILGQGVLLFSTEKILTATIPFCLLVIFILQRVYLQTSRQIRIIDLESRSPVYSQFLETLEGLVTIRAFGWKSNSIATNIKRLDVSQQPYYIMMCIQRWLNLVLDLLVAGIAVTIISLAVFFRGSTTGGQIGIALNIVLVFNSVLLRLVATWTRMETSLGAIARLKMLEETTICEDKPGEDFMPDDHWPSEGSIEFRQVTASYSPDAIALRNVSLKILPGQKLGICGRTGSGKSSLLLTLLRLLDLDSGIILVDNIDLQRLPRGLIRSRMIAVPQDPFMLKSSVRQNIDPSQSISEERIIDALTRVDLWSIIESRGGLDQDMKSQPLSQGQHQLFCLARAMLRDSKILILDEATSNVDIETDKRMQEIIRREFRDHTVITVAHRIETILDSDVVAVLDNGNLMEFGTPRELLGRPSRFKELTNK